MVDIAKSLASRVSKPWGYELIWAHSPFYAGKILHIEQGESLSRQFHRQKDEWQYVLAGRIRIEIGEAPDIESFLLGAGEGMHIPSGVIHRVVAMVSSDILEASTPELDDVVRLEDRYGRADTAATLVR